MAEINKADIKALRDRTGAGLSDVKKALEEAEGDIEVALDAIRKRGLAKAAKREGNTAKEGMVAVRIDDLTDKQIATLIELNAETDFVVKNAKFIALANDVLNAVADSGAEDTEAALAVPLGARTVNDAITEASGVMGERIALSRVIRVQGENVTTYLHHTSPDLPPSIGVIVAHDAAAAPVAKDIARHIAFANPQWLVREDVPAEIVAHETEIARETSINEGKPEAALPKIVEGRMNGFYKENVLTEQPLAQDSKTSVAQHVATTGGKITGYHRIRVGS
ncbi:MAG: translation elongation factor Ts [Cellulomonadaceae bacterium]|jgi:elongation factor Ts|nr:translation elongation factor Ts [Cellulomonadaceae bacterium]